MFTIFIALSINVYGQTTLDSTFSLECNGSLIDCLEKVSQKTTYKFAYKTKDIARKRIKIVSKKLTISGFLTKLEKEGIDHLTLPNNQIYIFLEPFNKTSIVSGYIISAANLERINDVEVWTTNGNKTGTDENGDFKIKFPQDSLLICKKDGYQISHIHLHSTENKLIISLQPITNYTEITIRTYDSITKSSISGIVYIPKNAKHLPTLGGEMDILAGAQLVGGIQQSVLNTPGLSVRGSNPDQNQIMLDGIPLYQGFHFMGLLSIFNAATINSVNIYKDAFPAKFGGKLSSYINVSLNDGSKRKISGSADAGILSTGFSINGPLKKEKASFSFSVRRSYFDFLVKPAQDFFNSNEYQQAANNLYFYDVFGKIHYRINNKNQVRFSIYQGGDNLLYGSKVRLKDSLQTRENNSANLFLSGLATGVSWHCDISTRLAMQVHSSVSTGNVAFNDQYSLGNIDKNESNSFTQKTANFTQRNTIDFDYFIGKKNRLYAGLGAVFSNLRPFDQRYQETTELIQFDTVLSSTVYKVRENFIYLENQMTLDPSTIITYGIRAVRFSNQSTVSAQNLLPRFSLKRALDKYNSFQFSYSHTAQQIFSVPNLSLGIPYQVWLPLAIGNKPMLGKQASVFWTFHKKSFLGSIGTFHKRAENVRRFPLGNSFTNNFFSSENLILGSTLSFGWESHCAYQIDRWFLNASYTYTNSTEKFKDINEGQRFKSSFDIRHAFNFLFGYSLSARSILSVHFQFYSGVPITLPTSRYITLINGTPILVENYTKINNFRLPNAHQLNVSYKKSFEHKGFSSQMVIGVFNVYNQLNPFIVYTGLNEKGEYTLKNRTFLPTMPILKYSIKF